MTIDDRQGQLAVEDHRLIAKIKRGLADPELSLRDRLVRGVKLFSETTGRRIVLNASRLMVSPPSRAPGRW